MVVFEKGSEKDREGSKGGRRERVEKEGKREEIMNSQSQGVRRPAHGVQEEEPGRVQGSALPAVRGHQGQLLHLLFRGIHF